MNCNYCKASPKDKIDEESIRTNGMCLSCDHVMYSVAEDEDYGE
jgi:hypothetical protein